MIPARKNDDLPLPRESPRALDGVQICLGAGVGEANALEVKARAEERGVLGFEFRGRAEVEAYI